MESEAHHEANEKTDCELVEFQYISGSFLAREMTRSGGRSRKIDQGKGPTMAWKITQACWLVDLLASLCESSLAPLLGWKLSANLELTFLYT